MKWHSYDISRLVPQLLPIALRRLYLVLFITALLSPLSWLLERIRYKMQHDGRVIYLEKVLNEMASIPSYDARSHESTKVIYIGPGEIPDDVWLFQEEEPDLPPYLFQEGETGEFFTWLFTQDELNEQYCDFTVVIPRTLRYMDTKFRYHLDYYKMAGKKYKIVYV